ncbi:MAG: hypothetical protein IM475_02945 [Microcystis sp. M061S2]|nr:hypothetical protein [Microcystis sp. M061S2]
MRAIKILCMFIGLGLIHSAPIQANNMSNDILISQSRRQYECTRNGVNPTISGSLFSDGYNCLIPISAGKCVGYADAFGYSRIGNSDPRGMISCKNVEIAEDRLTGKKYYRFSSGDKFILEGK